MLRKIVTISAVLFVMSAGSLPVSALTPSENNILSTLNTALLKTSKATASGPLVVTTVKNNGPVITYKATRDSTNNSINYTSSDGFEQEIRFINGDVYISKSSMDAPTPTQRLMIESAGQNPDADWVLWKKSDYQLGFAGQIADNFNYELKYILLDIKKNGSKKYSISKKMASGNSTVTVKLLKSGVKNTFFISNGLIVKYSLGNSGSGIKTSAISFQDSTVLAPEGTIQDESIVKNSSKYKYYMEMLNFEEDLNSYISEVMVMDEEKSYLKDILAVINKEKYKVSGQSIEYKTDSLGIDTYFCGVYDQKTSSFSIKEAAC